MTKAILTPRLVYLFLVPSLLVQAVSLPLHLSYTLTRLAFNLHPSARRARQLVSTG